MLLKRSNILEGILFPLFILSACTETEKPEAYIARVNNSYLTETEFYGMLDTQSVSEKQRTAIINNWVRQELLYQEAQKKGLTNTTDFKNNIRETERKLAASIVLQSIASVPLKDITEKELREYYYDQKSSFKLPYNAFFLNRINFSDRETAVGFRTELIQSGWNEAVKKFSDNSSVVNVTNETLVAEQDIYPVRLLRMLEGLYPLEISIVIPDDRGYYTVVQLLDKYSAQTIPPFEAVKKEVEIRYKGVLTELAIENYINDLYSLNEIEIKK